MVGDRRADDDEVDVVELVCMLPPQLPVDVGGAERGLHGAQFVAGAAVGDAHAAAEPKQVADRLTAAAEATKAMHQHPRAPARQRRIDRHRSVRARSARSRRVPTSAGAISPAGLPRSFASTATATLRSRGPCSR